ncbi:hypothetical protein [Vibrio natriegens]|uniref:Uncharacterized protein n=1 Tax=Vibrio natriegens NBRC 15636 = ATCC 14048 = DSM 759 TaxID=1219067 RepID=A0AAN0Y2A1_VIBNA|nr:hypothetical protein [Vibrio natriegens]ALR15756.1 hypothetical protein PN96_07070 [Vibrio natriegens NBRC 15636 = ATCC 14048 = DSM 759]ANQ12384.1 hypothetical protein BA890_06280 [Vibrio natriegens NBRC 15636 = ATCC 14048 = DSM 759]EPM42871.1 hypothetical protein M272_23735 [Vibrio natriegens NBRC 15636 = ATCC 14048 = DSM 759]MDX6026762.1 hypothetical protein [Vibrio natriegens NBRC 15636 = ATCC 14048 = DSM 759]UUI12844.1 hypothetical protein NP431_06275 [Vibrio natriegens]
MSKADQEVVAILKDVFQLKFVRPLKSDHNLRIWIIRSSFLVSIVVIIARVILEMTGYEIEVEFSSAFNTPIAFFFTSLFLHINNEVEDTSVIMFVLTWASLMIGLYI